jgi:hypothetical protein
MTKYHPFRLMLPVTIWKQIKASANINRRPITQEILIAVEEYLERKGIK